MKSLHILIKTYAWIFKHILCAVQNPFTLEVCISLMLFLIRPCLCGNRLNLRELGPWACHMRWLVWVMASFGTTYVFFFHERSDL